jgi:hypothetical protein
LKVKYHCGIRGDPHALFESIPEKPDLSFMILNPLSLLIQKLRDGVSSMRYSCHCMKELSTFITKFDHVDCVPFLLVNILVMEESGQLELDKKPEIAFCVI